MAGGQGSRPAPSPPHEAPPPRAPPPCLPSQVETQRFNATYARKHERTPLVEFLMLAASKAREMYGTAYAELARQASRAGGCW